MPPEPRLLVITPDFPPARGGIQVLAHRLAAGMEGFQTHVVAADAPGAAEFDASDDLTVRRVPPTRGSARDATSPSTPPPAARRCASDRS